MITSATETCGCVTRYGVCGALVELREDGRRWEIATGWPHGCYSYAARKAGRS